MISSSWVEAHAYDAIDKVLRGDRPEDSRIELKGRDVSDIARTARQLAAHANAARGEPIIWVFGVSENAREVDGVEMGEFSTWISRVEKHFNGPPPHMVYQLHRQRDDKTIVILAFDTRGAPFVVCNPKFNQERGHPQFEVPWRYGTRTKSAARSELIRFLAPLAEVPECELVDCELVSTIGIVGNRERDLSRVDGVHSIKRSW